MRTKIMRGLEDCVLSMYYTIRNHKKTIIKTVNGIPYMVNCEPIPKIDLKNKSNRML